MQHTSDIIGLAARFARCPSGIDYAPSSVLAKLAWVATLDVQRGRLAVVHGTRVECRPDWMVEGVWDGPFAAGEFHSGAHLFGSGIRLDAGAVHFVPSCALVDRLVYARDGERLLVSNSLIALLAVTGARLDPSHDYLVGAKDILSGIDRYRAVLPVLHPSIERVHQVFHKVLVVRDGSATLERTIPVREFASFHEYHSMLCERLAAICANARDAARAVPLAMYGTLSSGYDSAAVTTLVRRLGVRRYFTYEGAWDEQSTEDPSYRTGAIALALNVETVRLHVPREPAAIDELLLRAGSPLGYQAPLLAMARHVEERGEAALVFTGYHGGIVWGLDEPDEQAARGIARRDISGLDLTEVRLKTGFINVAVPFLHAASVKSIVAVSRGAEMAPWTLGRRYDRPISRRIVESAGVPRELFGMVKSGILGGGLLPVNSELREQYLQYLRRTVAPLPLLYARVGLDRCTMRALSAAAGIAKRVLRSPRAQAACRAGYARLQDGYSWYARANLRATSYVWAVTKLVDELRARGESLRSAARSEALPNSAASSTRASRAGAEDARGAHSL